MLAGTSCECSPDLLGHGVVLCPVHHVATAEAREWKSAWSMTAPYHQAYSVTWSMACNLAFAQIDCMIMCR